MIYLIFDTETTGFIQKGLPLTDPLQPKILQLAFMQVDSENFEVQNVVSLFINHDNLTIPQEAKNIHHIDEEKCRLLGVTESYALHIFERLWNQSDRHFAYNVQYDVDLIRCALLRLNRGELDAKLGHTIDVMEPFTNLCKLPGKYGKYKWPKLEEAYDFCFKTKPPLSHNALADVHATAKILGFYETSYGKKLCQTK